MIISATFSKTCNKKPIIIKATLVILFLHPQKIYLTPKKKINFNTNAYRFYCYEQNNKVFRRTERLKFQIQLPLTGINKI